MDMKLIGKEIKNRRLQLNLRMDDLAKIVHSNRSTLWSIENGTAKLSVPGLEPGLNNITIYYSGDNDYQEKTVTSVIPVARLSSSTEVFVEDKEKQD